ncbi:MAG: cytochrome C biogenesis protein [Candidatus Lloydbacteria bacterium CG22_combo_CG10-13_8_21_14_all_47_15]|uniref:Cytochrome C biogenesis protein n=1 Tax=Candidatus Lloydbacteria bacterium CG22_combo_CG10-13_8_21_14_all_47_15 TaxID=1974635 RepID=A0A2H0CUJ2_9BACT|nr:MAG: cytochrome C biogenesis protein [Candidatus Lloydbacteria bacterium CG22_combo_CG10-13_8_21_14_all_47_15]
MEIGIGFIFSAFFAGLLTFLAPCTLPLVPAYLGFISGVNQDDLKDPAIAALARRKILKNGIAFILGFTFVFIFFGALAGFLGQALVPARLWLGRIGGLLVIFFGLFMLGVFKLPALAGEHRIKVPKWLALGRPGSSFAIGGTFAFGWTPCVGPILGSILLLASTQTSVLQGTILLAVFSAGLAVPFLLIALGFSHATRYIEKFQKYLKWISIVGGIFLIILGFLLLTDNFGLTIQYGYKLFNFINYDRLLEYL